MPISKRIIAAMDSSLPIKALDLGIDHNTTGLMRSRRRDILPEKIHFKMEFNLIVKLRFGKL